MRELRGKVAVVTGGASGIGRAMAARFVSEGMRVVLADVEAKALEAARAELGARGEVLAVETDVSSLASVEALAARTFERFGAAHVLCNNAGIGVGGMAWELSQADWDWVLGVNLGGVVHGVRVFVPRMIEQGEGHVVNTASIAGLLSVPGMAPYAASKHAVAALTECLHHDLQVSGLGDKIQASVLCPGWVRTHIAASERNRPASLPRRAREPSPQEQALQGLMTQAIASGMAPEEVASQVLDAIVHERFWVLTHPETKKAVAHRMNGILEGRAPEFNPAAV